MAEPIRARRGKRAKQRERRGAGAAWSPGAGAGSGGLAAPGAPAGLGASLAPAAPGGAASAPVWSSALSSISQATGLSTLAAGKAGVAGLVIMVTSAVVGLSLIIGNSTPSSRPRHGARVFRLAQPPAGGTSAVPSRQAAAPADVSSLEFLAGTNPEIDDSLDGINEKAVGAPAPAAPMATAKPPVKPAQTPQPFAKPKMKAGKKPSIQKSQLASKVSMVPLRDLTGGVGGNFQDIYQPGQAGAYQAGQRRARIGASRRSVTPASGGSAYGQAKFTNKMSRQGARMDAAHSAASYSAQPFDGSNLGSTGAVPEAGGSVLGSSGLGAGANSVVDVRDITAPPPPDDVKNAANETPYQGLLYAAMGALMIGMLLLQMAGKLIGQSRTATDPMTKTALLSQGKALAMAAMGAGGAAAGLGAMIGSQFGQLQQGLPFIIGGGALAVQAGMVLAKAEQAGEEAQSTTNNAASQLGSVVQQALGGGPNQGGDQVKDNQLDNSTAKPQVNINRHSSPNYSGDLPSQ